MKKIEEYTPCELATLATALVAIIAQKFSAEENSVVGNFFQTMGQSISMIASQDEYLKKQEEKECEEKGSSHKELQKQIDELRGYIIKLEGNKNF